MTVILELDGNFSRTRVKGVVSIVSLPDEIKLVVPGDRDSIFRKDYIISMEVIP
jgi:hypothetical protein